MADGTRLKTIENQLAQLSETVSVQLNHQLTQLTDTVTSHSASISDTAVTLQRMETLLNRLSVTHGQHNHREQPFHTRNVRLEFPRFDGSDALAWIFKANQFFDYYHTPDPERLTIAAVHLDQSVVPWFQMIQRASPFRSWQEFTRAIELEYGPSAYERPRTTLFKLAQTGSVNEYYVQFTALANRVTGIDAEALLDCFLSGLQKELQREVISQNPTSLIHAVSIARLFEDKYQPIKPNNQTHLAKSISSSYQSRPTNSQGSISNPSPKPNSAPLLPTPTNRTTNPSRGIKSISPAEMQLRRDKGLCYYCDEKFSFRHRCPNKNLFYLQLEDPNSSEHENDDQTSPTTETPHSVSEQDLHLSLNALNGSKNVGTLRFTGSIADSAVQILIDGGSSDNFFQPRLAKFLQLPVEPAPGFNVLVGNGQSLMAEGKISQLSVKIQGHKLVLPVFLLPFSELI
jgi:hypothetical protein